jgi:hypothetical protein
MVRAPTPILPRLNPFRGPDLPHEAGETLGCSAIIPRANGAGAQRDQRVEEGFRGAQEHCPATRFLRDDA